jgi:hypothetical protein
LRIPSAIVVERIDLLAEVRTHAGTLPSSTATGAPWLVFVDVVAVVEDDIEIRNLAQVAIRREQGFRLVEVLRRIADGNRNQDIAALLSISEETVKVHIRHIMEKLGARDRTQAVAIAVRRGIFQI